MKKTLTTHLAKKTPRLGQGLYYDPLYGHIPTSNELRQLIDLEVFQRLRGIRQLSTLYLVFPGAVHTRFEHSIGVGYLAQIVHQRLRAYVEQTRDAAASGIRLDEVTLRVMELAGLLHDIGHGPFGHVFEMFCRRDPRYRVWNHEDWGERLITGMNTDNTLLDDPIYRQIPEFLRQLRDMLAQRYGELETLELLEPENIARISFGKPPRLSTDELTRKYYFLKDVVPSVFGIDRLDYLRRDAFHTGVKTGDIDIWEIVGNLHIRFAADGYSHLYLFPSAANAVEALVRTRDAVYRHLYHNPIHRSAQELLIRALLELDRSPEDLAFLSDFELLDLFARSGRPFLREAEERLRFRILYEVHPLGSHADIHKYEATIEGYWREAGGWREFSGREETLGGSVGISGAKKIFYDLEKVPAIKPEDLTSPVFYDPVSRSERNLLQLKPYLATLYEGDVIAGVTKVHAYNDSVSQFFLSFPYDHLESEVSNMAEEEIEDLDARLLALYQLKLEPLVLGFFSDILGVEIESQGGGSNHQQGPDPSVVGSIAAAKQHFLYYLRDLVEIKQALWLGGGK